MQEVRFQRKALHLVEGERPEKEHKEKSDLSQVWAKRTSCSEEEAAWFISREPSVAGLGSVRDWARSGQLGVNGDKKWGALRASFSRNAIGSGKAEL